MKEQTPYLTIDLSITARKFTVPKLTPEVSDYQSF